MMQLPEHTVIIQSMGGANVLTCQALGINNIEHPYDELTAESVKKTILNYKYLKEEDAGFDLLIVDARPPVENFNEKRERESKEFKKSNNVLASAKLFK